MKLLDRIFLSQLLKRRVKDADEKWLTSENGHRFKVEEQTGKIVKGFGGTLNGRS